MTATHADTRYPEAPSTYTSTSSKPSRSAKAARIRRSFSTASDEVEMRGEMYPRSEGLIGTSSPSPSTARDVGRHRFRDPGSESEVEWLGREHNVSPITIAGASAVTSRGVDRDLSADRLMIRHYEGTLVSGSDAAS
jgi:hypothetical protein